jgi:hypothetical protein
MMGEFLQRRDVGALAPGRGFPESGGGAPIPVPATLVNLQASLDRLLQTQGQLNADICRLADRLGGQRTPRDMEGKPAGPNNQAIASIVEELTDQCYQAHHVLGLMRGHFERIEIAVGTAAPSNAAG